MISLILNKMYEWSYKKGYEIIRGDVSKGIPPIGGIGFNPKSKQFEFRTSGEVLTRK
jgi:hypothetical protein